MVQKEEEDFYSVLSRMAVWIFVIKGICGVVWTCAPWESKGSRESRQLTIESIMFYKDTQSIILNISKYIFIRFHFIKKKVAIF